MESFTLPILILISGSIFTGVCLFFIVIFILEFREFKGTESGSVK
jgi:formate-dependent nitrite reductase membrane component NrfD